MAKKKAKTRTNKDVGRPSKISQEIIKNITDALKTGAYIETAAVYAGIDKKTLYTWLKKGNRKEGAIYVQFLHAVDNAMAEAELIDIQNLQKAAQRDWRASAWRLERKFPNKWGYKQQIKELDPDDDLNHKSIIDEITED